MTLKWVLKKLTQCITHKKEDKNDVMVVEYKQVDHSFLRVLYTSLVIFHVYGLLRSILSCSHKDDLTSRRYQTGIRM